MADVSENGSDPGNPDLLESLGVTAVNAAQVERKLLAKARILLA